MQQNQKIFYYKPHYNSMKQILLQLWLGKISFETAVKLLMYYD